ncbi:MipA/OmpV family protein [uncultured Sphingomonas sp.]|uniref:MipA/OmpV family protein n=1 Tax=uncultured Sphingomonas sp. TaxID=158754 RepID=UPI0035C9FB15
MRLIAPVVAGVILIAQPAFAQDTGPVAAPPADNDRTRVTVGLGAVSLPDYDGADTNDIIPGAVAVGRIDGYDFFTRGTQLYVDLARDPPGPGTGFELGVIGAFRRERVSNIDDRQVRALGKIDTAYEAGAFVGVSRTGVIISDFDTLTARVGVVQDVGSAHKSYVVTPQLNYTTPLSLSTLVSLGVAADYVGKGYGRTYYSITPAQTLTSGLRAYDAGESGWKQINFSLFGVQSLSGDLRRGFGVGGGVLYGRLLGRYKNSPIVRDVGDKHQWSVAGGVTYTF